MFKKSPFLVFSAKLLGSYVLWRVIYYLLEAFNVPLWNSLKNFIAAKTLIIAAWMATHIFKLEVIYNSRNLLMEGQNGIFLADHCLAIPAVVIFGLFILFYKGRSIDKAWFIPVGALLIFLINSMRIAALAYVQKYYSANFFELAHSRYYLILTYGLIFLLIVWWVELLAPKDDII